jgi:hypothetical protein
MIGTSRDSEPRTTGQVVERLQRLRLPATLSSIEADTKAHYLPERETAHRGRAGVTGLWEPWMERRAERLYRLRALARRTGGRGPSGDVLRLLLFFADAWGWEFVKSRCIEGYRMMVRAATRGVANRSRKKRLDPENLWFLAEDIAVDQYRPETPTPAQIDRVKMTVGLLRFGFAPDSSLGTLDGVLDVIAQRDVEPDVLRQWKALAPLMWSLANPSEGNVIELVDSVDHATVTAAVSEFRRNIFFIRRAIRRKFGKSPEGKVISNNPFTFFGAASQREFAQAFRKMPTRITPAQMLGGHFASSLVGTHGLRALTKPSWFLTRFLQWYLQSEEFEGALRQAEREL